MTNVDSYLDISDLPQDCIDDCSSSGQVDSAIDYWIAKLEFTVNRTRAIDCLAGYGAWSDEELAASTDEEIAGRILWLACCDFHEQQVWEERNPDKAPENSDYGSSCFYLE